MIDLGVSKIFLIGAVALIVIGPDKLPGVARTLGALLGKAQRYVADVKAEVNRSMELDELRKMKETVESAARDVSSSVQSTATDFEKDWSDATRGLDTATASYGSAYDTSGSLSAPLSTPYPEYQRPKKNWRVKRGTVPQWYKAQAGVRSKAQSGAARVARFRPRASGS
jgi:sec-independent protein translocase protein TatB